MNRHKFLETMGIGTTAVAMSPNQVFSHTGRRPKRLKVTHCTSFMVELTKDV